MKELFKCFLTGLSGFAVLGLLGYGTWALWPYSGYAWGGLFFCSVCIGLGCDIRSGRCPR